MTQHITQERAVAQEASRLLGNMSRMAGYHGTTSAAVVGYMCENCSMTVFCYGELRNIVFTPITSKSFAFKTEAVWER